LNINISFKLNLPELNITTTQIPTTSAKSPFVAFNIFSVCIAMVILSVLLTGCAVETNKSDKDENDHSNHLKGSTSAYLLQHANNPVDWYPWGEEALRKAEAENKMLIISVGYAACHWCHVMEHESFEDSTVAELMNEHFVNIKVDREERPDIDDVYMTACQLASRQGCGWPLNAFALSDGRPVWAGTYFPKKDWLVILNEFIRLQKEDPEQLITFAQQLGQGYEQIQAISPRPGAFAFDEVPIQEQVGIFKGMLDETHGGRKGAPKFPMPNNYEFLMRYAYEFGDSELDGQIHLTLDKIANGGIYDHVGGGFARYSTDEEWHVPHFEKMLYDNGQLLKLYATAYKKYGDQLYAEKILETINWMREDLLDPKGGLYSSLDADSEGEEGKFYVWTYDEIETIVENEEASEVFAWQYDVTETGNWEKGLNVLRLQHSDAEAVKKFNITLEDAKANRKQILSKLYNERQKRTRPGLDDKVLTSWNALAADGLFEAYEALGADEYRQLGIKILDFLITEMMQNDGRLMRTYAKEKKGVNAFLDDYAAMIQALIHAYEVTFDERFLDNAKKLANYALEHFGDEANPILFYTSDLDPPLVTRQKDWNDNVIPSSNSIFARGLFDLGLYLYNEDFRNRASEMLSTVMPQMLESNQPPYYTNWYLLYLDIIEMPYEVAILGPESMEIAKDLQAKYLPSCRFLGGTDEGSLELLKDKLKEDQTTIYVCQNKVCKLPVTKVEEALELIL
jgi:hypothetical protein